mmetsp:Transcript_42546/g.113648  ORF Transcript_42546/g.113648 Transcript_42546/m.113648 type:complete len:291 (+) Transcript_42546:54-926(+)
MGIHVYATGRTTVGREGSPVGARVKVIEKVEEGHDLSRLTVPLYDRVARHVVLGVPVDGEDRVGRAAVHAHVNARLVAHAIQRNVGHVLGQDGGLLESVRAQGAVARQREHVARERVARLSAAGLGPPHHLASLVEGHLAVGLVVDHEYLIRGAALDRRKGRGFVEDVNARGRGGDVSGQHHVGLIVLGRLDPDVVLGVGLEAHDLHGLVRIEGHARLEEVALAICHVVLNVEDGRVRARHVEGQRVDRVLGQGHRRRREHEARKERERENRLHVAGRVRWVRARGGGRR